MGCDKVSLYSPFIQRFTDVLAQDGRFGMCQSVARIKDTKSGATSVTQGPCGDRFKIALNYAAYTIEWEVLFNHHCPEEPPDFILSQEEFQPQLEHIQSLVNWDAADPRALLNTVNEMLEEYKRYQASILTEASMLNYHYTSLLDQNEEFHLSDSDIEIHAAKKGPRIGPINFLMKLPVDFTRIPPYLTKDCPGEDSAVLVTFQNAEGGKVTPQLYLSPRVEHVLDGVGALRIPGYPAGGLLLDYVPTVCQLLQAKVDQLSTSYEKRKEYISAFLSQFGRGVIEYDVESFQTISLLLEWHDFFFVVSVELTVEFPTSQPVLMMQSVYHQSEEGGPYLKAHTTYPYSPRWSPAEMAERARIFLLDSIAQFQRGSVTEGSYNVD